MKMISAPRTRVFAERNRSLDIAKNPGPSIVDGGSGFVVKGLINLNNICFFSSVLQNLLSVNRLRAHFMEMVEQVGPLHMALKNLVNETSPATRSREAISPICIFQCLAEKVPKYEGCQQHDSHELLRCLLDELNEEELRNQGPNVIKSTFGGRISSTISCLECASSSRVDEQYLDLSLPIPSKKLPCGKLGSVSGKKRKLESPHLDVNSNSCQNVTVLQPPCGATSSFQQTGMDICKIIEDAVARVTRSESSGPSITPNEKPSVPANLSTDEEFETEASKRDETLRRECGVSPPAMDSKCNESLDYLFEDLLENKIAECGPINYYSESLPDEVVNIDSPVSLESCFACFTKLERLNCWQCSDCIKQKRVQSEKNDALRGGTSGQAVGSELRGSGSDNDRSNPESMKKKRGGTKRILIDQAPPVLTIHLKRFIQGPDGRLSKLASHVDFRYALDLAPFMEPRSLETDEYQYRLIGMVEHLGTMGEGHYVAYVRGLKITRGDGTENTDSAWYRVSDDHVLEASLEEVLLAEAYILFYEKL
ncbi:ubiquitin carboxyl-terminal hydrolase 2-like [Diospyros lotus]|uniref:ubiquitin carboxyl-terminal hydrolase 2-like n=1 Tax=Diospyros lotus TaxID=55363 RepID=UPI00225ABFD6|nr:ubiquitin carboxyl-terminal hydrolase 2-like [Diospyros lotus]